MSMARLWRDQGKPKVARDLIAPVYGWFTEGFDTLDLKEAKALIPWPVLEAIALTIWWKAEYGDRLWLAMTSVVGTERQDGRSAILSLMAEKRTWSGHRRNGGFDPGCVKTHRFV